MVSTLAELLSRPFAAQLLEVGVVGVRVGGVDGCQTVHGADVLRAWRQYVCVQVTPPGPIPH